MIQKWLCHILCLVGTIQVAQAQTVFTYGNKKVDKQEFLQAFQKNPTLEKNRKKALEEYLTLYSQYKLKVQAAYDAGLDSNENFKYESANFKRSIVANAINEEANVQQLTKEAFAHSLFDIQLQHVAIEVAPGADSTTAYNQIQKAYKQLQGGRDFLSTTLEFSSDEAVRKQQGMIGWITVFTLPYDLEKMVYNTPVGKFTAPYRSSKGYHIFKVVQKRNAIGKCTVQQVLIPVFNGANEAEKKYAKRKADSLYEIAQSAKGFEVAASMFNLTPVDIEVAVGQYDEVYANKAYALKRKGDLAAPFETQYGWHVLQLKSQQPIATDTTQAETVQALRAKVESDNRMEEARNVLIKKWMQQTQLSKANIPAKALFDFADAYVGGRSLDSVVGIQRSTVIFTYPKQKVTAEEFGKFAKAVRLSGNSISTAPYEVLLDEFYKIATGEYYKNNLELFNTKVAAQLQEFNEANLLFSMMDQEVWSKAAADTVGLQKFYAANKGKYVWTKSVSAIVVTALGKAKADSMAQFVKANPTRWKQVTQLLAGEGFADSSRFEIEQLPTTQPLAYTVGACSTPEKNTNDDGYTFVYIIAVHPANDPKSFQDARGLAIAGYQQFLEKQWVASLQKKYPIKFNDAVVKQLLQ
ncbi:MAG: peptidyl-prolyl cis-trans isomerase [Bacteroidetes bacterium]|nr:MAG: peptidyl-prolyl cis-trans isomerase [Bacteroidota bacterium]TAF93122.1 MAG: peptidyl-prolyl cis-trans isomerase [Bacteroidota bacterium]